MNAGLRILTHLHATYPHQQTTQQIARALGYQTKHIGPWATKLYRAGLVNRERDETKQGQPYLYRAALPPAVVRHRED